MSRTTTTASAPLPMMAILAGILALIIAVTAGA